MPDAPADTATTDAAADATATTDASSTDTADDATDWKAEAEKHKALSRKHEERAKTNANAAKELAELRTASMSEQEKAVADARAEARTEALREVGAKVIDAEVRAAAAGRNVDVDALLEGLDRTKFLDADGEADRDAITAWIDRVAPATEETAPAFPDVGQGTRGGDAAALALNGDPLTKMLANAVGAPRK